MSRFNALLLLAATSLVTPAFSADPPRGTTGEPRPAAAAPAAPAEEIDPATGLARTTVVKPLTDAPPVPDTKRAPRVARPHVELILPTGSAALGKLAEALRAGFAAAAEVGAKDSPPIEFTAIDAEGNALVDACRAAQASGALLVVAGITRDGATALARSDCSKGPILALNEPQTVAVDLPPTLYWVTLSLENEARQSALLAVSEGAHTAVVITSPSALAKRVQEAFEREWSRDAGQTVARITFSGTDDDAPLVRERLAGVRADIVFMALEPAQARMVRPYISGMLPLYATSMSVNPRAEAIVNVDLQGVRYPEMPWFVQPDHPAVMVYPAPRNMSVEEERLYALGIDAFRIAMQLLRGEKRAPIDGVTGKLTLEANGQFSRALTPSEVDGGRVIPLRAP